MKNGTKKLSIIDLGKCEDKLRQKNNLNESISLIIISVEKDTDIASERNVQFEVYESLNKKKLNLNSIHNHLVYSTSSAPPVAVPLAPGLGPAPGAPAPG